jgi:hypothetical protein
MLQRGILLSQSSVFPPLIPDSALIKSNAEGIPGKLLPASIVLNLPGVLTMKLEAQLYLNFKRYRYRLETAHRDYLACPILLSHCIQHSQVLTSSGLDKNFFDQVDLHIAHISRHPDGGLNFLVFNRAHLQLFYSSVALFLNHHQLFQVPSAIG